MNDIFEKNHPMKDDKEFITSYWSDRARDFGSLRAKELESPKLKLWRMRVARFQSGKCYSHLACNFKLPYIF